APSPGIVHPPGAGAEAVALLAGEEVTDPHGRAALDPRRPSGVRDTERLDAVAVDLLERDVGARGRDCPGDRPAAAPAGRGAQVGLPAAIAAASSSASAGPSSAARIGASAGNSSAQRSRLARLSVPSRRCARFQVAGRTVWKRTRAATTRP